MHANVAVFVPNLGCPHRCSFCDQRRISGQTRMPMPDEVADTAREGLKTLGAQASEAEFAFFGGSFTAIPRPAMAALLAAARPFVSLEGRPGFYRGIRLSTRPDAIDAEVLALLRANGVTAVELGAQSMENGVLAANGRGHTAADVVRAAGLIRKAGLELGLQMMTGLYTDTDEGALRTARVLCALKPATVRVYPTLVVRGTELEQLWRAGLYSPQTLDGAVSLCARLLGLFEDAGVRVIRMGLHAGPGLEESVLAGPFHPAFRELCEGRIFYEKALALLDGAFAGGGFPGPATLWVAPRAVSKMAGQHRQNLEALSRRFGIPVKAAGQPGLAGYDIRLSLGGHAVPARGR